MSDVQTILAKAKNASYRMAGLTTDQKNKLLEEFAKALEASASTIIQENLKDQKLNKGKIAEPLFQRLVMNSEKLDHLVDGVRDVIRLEDPAGKTLFRRELDKGLILEKKTVPLGVLTIIFEARPDAVPQILSLALKSGNVVVLKGGSEAKLSVAAIVDVAQKMAKKFPELPEEWAQSLDTREQIKEVLAFPQYVDLVIPRGSGQLVKSIQESTTIPVLGHAEGICHVYVHKSADLKMASKIVLDGKTQYPAACNSIETLLVDEGIAKDFLAAVIPELIHAKVEVRGCKKTILYAPNVKPATEEDWRTEYSDLILSIKIVKDASEAINHINTYGSHHTDTIVAKDEHTQALFLNSVDSAGVFANASTRFADGFRYGFGAEVGVSTSKTHARGPVGLDGLVTSKYLLTGHGEIVADYSGPKAKKFTHKDL
jgi:glutamate-5-semialdehyde dehydrogenase